jgi:oligoribonuclease
MSSNAKALLWVDLETTGTNEIEDAIIEVGAILTDFELTPIASFQAICRPSDHAYKRMLNNGIVQQMHTDNGLAALLYEPMAQGIENVDAQLYALVRKHVPKGRVILAGSGVSHFDRRFIDAQLWGTASLLVRPMIDVGVIRRFFRLADVKLQYAEQVVKNHRAFDDITLHLNEAREYLQFIIKAMWSTDA